MRPPVPEHKTVYVRFHKRIDALLTEFSEKTGMRRATAVVWVQDRFMEALFADGRSVESVDKEALGFTGIEETYFITLGRGTEGSMLGRGMQITVNKANERRMQLIALQNDLSLRDLRTGILVQYFREIRMI